jgi:ribosomal protein S18 acetylase RimI-like enzyme
MMEYRAINQNDYSIFHELANAYYREGEDENTPQAEIDGFIKFMFDKVVEKEIFGCFATVDGSYVGFALWTVDTESFQFSEIPGYGTILEIGIAKGHRTSGLGRQLVSFVENSLSTGGIKDCYVCAYGPARDFWSRCGYADSGKIAKSGLPIMVKSIGLDH